MTRGRKPKSTRLKILEGTRADRLNPYEPRFPPSSVNPPGWLEGHALAHWNEFAPYLIQTGRLTVADRTALAMMCVDYADIQKAKEAGPIERVVSHARKTTVRIDPNDADAARKRCLWWLTQFGLTPSSRSRVSTAPAPPSDRMGEFLKQRS
jgi:P27 family predicted phage terminase small subunit